MNYQDPLLNRLTSLTEVELDAKCERVYPQQRKGWVKVSLDNGKFIERTKPDLGLVLTSSDHVAIIDKLRSTVKRVFGEEKGAKVLGSIETFTDLDDTSRLFTKN